MKRILIVDDEEPVRNVLTEFLTRKGYDARAVETGPLALAEIPIFRPNLVLLDIRMPGMNGLEVLNRIIQKHPDQSVIMLTAEDQEETGRRAMASGAKDYLTKPLNFEQLDSHLSVHLLFQGDV